MIGLVLAQTFAQAVEPGGYRVHVVPRSHAVSLAETVVVGPDGRVAVTAASLDLGLRDVIAGASLPLARYAAPAGSRVDPGNLTLEAWFAPDRSAALRAVGVVAHVETGGGAYTWANRPEELWPGTGADAVVILQRPLGGEGVVGLLQGALGLHGAAAYAPFPGVYPRVQLAGAVDGGVPGVPALGLVGEVAASWWDTSPLDLAALARLDPVDHVRMRVGMVLPVSTWTGADPAAGTAGLREATLSVDLSLVR